jgi:large subunit ribosomal protein L46
VQEVADAPSPPQTTASAEFHAAQPAFSVKAGIVLSRPPLITPDPHPFETAYYLYQRRLNERLVLPFTQYFYYRRNTPAFEHWRKHRRERNGVAARDIGNYNAYTPDSWNDEVLVGDATGSPDRIVEKLVAEEGRQSEFTGKGDPRFAGLRRTTEADEKNDTRSLERSLQRTLYLLVKTKGAKGDEDAEKRKWKFPSGPVVGFEGLKEVRRTVLLLLTLKLMLCFQAAQRILFTSLGPNMNTFFVGNHPVGHYIARFSSPQAQLLPRRYIPDVSPAAATGLPAIEPSSPALDVAKTPNPTAEVAQKHDFSPVETQLTAEKTFFMKARIMAGQADPSLAQGMNKDQENADAIQKKVEVGSDVIEDFQWLSKDEVEATVHPDYWRSIKNMLVAQ